MPAAGKLKGGQLTTCSRVKVFLAILTPLVEVGILWRGSGYNVTMNEEQHITEQPIEAQLVEAQPNEAQPPEPQSQTPSRRLRELLAIPDRDRTDAVWDEIIGLEIDLAPGNRALSPQADVGRRQEPGRRQEQVRQPQPTFGAKPVRRFAKKSRRGPGTPTRA